MVGNGCETETLKCYYMVEPGKLVAVTRQLPKNQKVDVELDEYADYADDLTLVQHCEHLVALTSTVSSILYTPKSVNSTTKHALLNACDYLNLFGESGMTKSKTKKVKLSPIPKPTTATTVNIALVRSGNFPVTDFTPHLKHYFRSTKLLHTRHLFSLKIPKTPENVELATWLAHLSRNPTFVQHTYPVHFSVTGAKCGEEDIAGFFYISSESTTLYQSGDTHVNLPCYVPYQRLHHFYRPEIGRLVRLLTAQQNGVPSTGVFPVILAAEQGSCKKELIRNVAGELGVGIHHVRGINYCGEAAGALETKYKQLYTQLQHTTPSLILLDQLSLLGRTRDGAAPDPRVIRALTQLFTDIRTLSTDHSVYVIGTCANTDSVLMEIRHLFNACVQVTKPSSDHLTKFLKMSLRFDDQVDVEKVVSSQLHQASFRKTLKFIDNLDAQMGLGLNDNQIITQKQCESVMSELNMTGDKKPAAIPQTSWDDIGGIAHVRQEIEETIEMPLKYPHLFGKHLRRSGLLLHGKPGCGKTLVARAVASQCNLHFISVQGPELLNSFVGQSEDNVRKIFENARKVAPAIIFFDEIDAIAPKRSGGVLDRVLAQLLAEMDGIHESGSIFMVGATNRPELLDPAITRPGRLDKKVEVSVGNDIDSRVQVFKALSRNLNLSSSVNFTRLSEMCGARSGAECYGVLLEACYTAIERCVSEGKSMLEIKQNDLISVVTNY